MYKLLVFFFFFMACKTTTGEIAVVKKSIEDVNLDVVEKKLNFKITTPDTMNSLINNWFNNHVKVNGFDGRATIEIVSYEEKLTNIENGKKIEIILNLTIMLENKNFSHRKTFYFELNEFSTITGNFSLNEVDTMILNTQINLVNRFSKNLNSKI